MTPPETTTETAVRIEAEVRGPVHTEERCTPVRKIIARVGDKWSILTIMLLKERPYRFGELRRSIDGISQRMLTLTVRGLERDGLVTRTVFPTNPPQVQYALTKLGQSLCEPVHALGQWAHDNLSEIVAARRQFDASRAEVFGEGSEETK